jgi:hypothetical protein
MSSPHSIPGLRPAHWPALLAIAALTASLAGCTGAHRTAGTGVAAHALAPDDAPLHPNRNAQYTEIDSTPRLVPRPSAEDAASAQPCEDHVLSVSEIAANVNGNYRSIRLAFLNRGATACKLGGYPKIALLGSGGGKAGSIAIEKATSSTILAEMSETGSLTKTAVATDPATESGTNPGPDASPEVILMPHSVAAFQLVWQSGPDCRSVSGIEVTAPGTAHAWPIPHPLTVCAGRIQVTALRLDDGGA